MSRNPFDSSRATRSPGESWIGVAQMCGVRPIDAKSTRVSVSRRSNAAGSSGQRRALEPVPERLPLDRIVEKDRVAQVTQVAARDGVDARLVQEQTPHRGVIEVGHRRHDSRA